MEENRLDKMKNINLEDLTPEEIISMKYSREIDDCVKCPECGYGIEFCEDNIDLVPLTDDSYEEMDYEDYDDIDDDEVKMFSCPYCHYFTFVNRFSTVYTDDLIDLPNCEELLKGITDAYNRL